MTQDFKIQIATVAHQDDSVALQKWVDHWKNRGQLVVLITGDISAVTVEFPEDAIVESVFPADEPPEMVANLLPALFADGARVMRAWIDETMPDASWKELLKRVNGNDEIAVWMVSRRTIIDDIDRTSTLLRDADAHDWTPGITLGPAIRYNQSVLQHPNMMAPIPLMAFADADKIYIERKHTLDSAIRANERMMPYLRQSDNNGLAAVNARLKQVCGEAHE